MPAAPNCHTYSHLLPPAQNVLVWWTDQVNSAALLANRKGLNSIVQATLWELWKEQTFKQHHMPPSVPVHVIEDSLRGCLLRSLVAVCLARTAPAFCLPCVCFEARQATRPRRRN